MKHRLLELLITHKELIDVTQRELAISLGVSQPRISDLCNRKVELFSVDKLLDYCDICGLEFQIKPL